MENVINWFEIPVSDFNRAKKFYDTILNVEIQEMEMFGSKMGFFPSDGKGVSGSIVKGEDYVPSQSGSLLYLNGGNDLNVVLHRVSAAAGTVIVPKTQISPEMGHFAIFIDTEGNKIALHSIG